MHSVHVLGIYDRAGHQDRGSCCIEALDTLGGLGTWDTY